MVEYISKPFALIKLKKWKLELLIIIVIKNTLKVNTEPKMSLAFRLNVVGEYFVTTSKFAFHFILHRCRAFAFNFNGCVCVREKVELLFVGNDFVKCFDYYRIKWTAIMSETLPDFNNTGNAKNIASCVCVSAKGGPRFFFQRFASFLEYCW